MIVYRVEAKATKCHRNDAMYKGPYNLQSNVEDYPSYKHVAEVIGFSYEADHCPGPINDKLLADTWRRLFKEETARSYYFGFPSLVHLKNWFDNHDAYKDVDDVACVRVYECETVIVGDKQVIFNSEDDVQFIEEIRLGSLV